MSFASDSFYLTFNFCGVGVELRASYMLGKSPTTKQHPSLLKYISNLRSQCAMCQRAACCMAGWCSTVQVQYILFTHSPVCSHFGCLHPLAIVDNGIVNTGMKDFT